MSTLAPRTTRPRLQAVLPPSLEAPALARAMLRRHLASWRRSQLFVEASLVLSELVTNAVQHGNATRSLALEIVAKPHGTLRLAVADHSRARPVLRQPDAKGGRGLHIIQELASRWGVEDALRGKWVWAELVHPA